MVIRFSSESGAERMSQLSRQVAAMRVLVKTPDEGSEALRSEAAWVADTIERAGIESFSGAVKRTLLQLAHVIVDADLDDRYPELERIADLVLSWEEFHDREIAVPEIRDQIESAPTVGNVRAWLDEICR